MLAAQVRPAQQGLQAYPVPSESRAASLPPLLLPDSPQAATSANLNSLSWHFEKAWNSSPAPPLPPWLCEDLPARHLAQPAPQALHVLRLRQRAAPTALRLLAFRYSSGPLHSARLH